MMAEEVDGEAQAEGDAEAGTAEAAERVAWEEAAGEAGKAEGASAEEQEGEAGQAA